MCVIISLFLLTVAIIYVYFVHLVHITKVKYDLVVAECLINLFGQYF